MSTKRSNSTSSKKETSSLHEDSNELACYREGYRMAGIKLGKDPIPRYLPATKEYRWWMAGWDFWVSKHEKHIINEGQDVS